jgi:hypothetical protein
LRDISIVLKSTRSDRSTRRSKSSESLARDFQTKNLRSMFLAEVFSNKNGSRTTRGFKQLLHTT